MQKAHLNILISNKRVSDKNKGFNLCDITIYIKKKLKHKTVKI